MDVNKLFEELSIKEIKQQNIKTRTEIETKKEELRFLVSERYRDIIDAADTIFEMKTCASNINDSLKTINNIYKNWNGLILKQSLSGSNRVDNESDSKKHRLSVAAQIKLILNMSELIWNALETKKFSKASILFNICRNISIHSQLMSNKYQDEELNIQIIFNRHWSSLSNLETTIGLVCRNYLKSTKIRHTIDDVLDCLIGILLLENRGISFVLKEYLTCVEHQIIELFSLQNSCMPVIQQLHSVADIIMSAISNVYQLFIKNILIEKLDEMSHLLVKEMDCTQEERIYLYLPNEIAGFRPAHKAFQQNCEAENLSDVVSVANDWLKSCRDKYESSFVLSFKHITTIKSISEIRLDLETTFNKKVEEPNKNKEWLELENENTIRWKTIINNMYSIKLKEMIDENIFVIFSNWCKSIERFMESNVNLLNEGEFDGDSFFNYYWTEYNKDVFFQSESSVSAFSPDNSSSIYKTVFESLYNHFLNFFDMGSSASSKSCSFESLVVKFKIIRPEIYQITRIFNNHLLELLREVINTINDGEDFIWVILKDCLASIVDKCNNWARKFMLDENQDSNHSVDFSKHEKLFYDFKSDGIKIITPYLLKVLIVTQSLRTIYEMLPSFQAGLMSSVFHSENIKMSSTDSKTVQKRKLKNSRLPFLPGKRINHQQDLELSMWTVWNEIIDPIKETVDLFMIKGTKSCISSFVSTYFQFVKYGLSSKDVNNEICTNWMKINTSNSELNNEISCLEAPMQCSWPMHMLLLNVSHLLSIFGAPTLTGKSNDRIRLQILETVIENFKIIQDCEEFQERKYIQKQNIQLIFDLRLLLEIVNAKTGIDKDIQDKLRNLLGEIEKRVDPFDYEMMSEALHQNLTQNMARNSTLYLLLSSNQPKKNMSFGQKLDIGTTQHNLIDLVGSVSGKVTKSNLRFGMLPVSGYTLMDKNFTSESSKAPATNNCKIPERTVVVINNSLKDTHDFPVNVQSSNKSYFGRLGSNWF